MLMSDINPLTLHPQATQLALSLYARKCYPDFSDLIHQNIDGQFKHYVDEHKADLYALLEESIDATMTLGQITVACDKALWRATNHFGGVI
jgi:hypothetical protein